jgi:septal ring-binding cell division protein DamX
MPPYIQKISSIIIFLFSIAFFLRGLTFLPIPNKTKKFISMVLLKASIFYIAPDSVLNINTDSTPDQGMNIEGGNNNANSAPTSDTNTNSSANSTTVVNTTNTNTATPTPANNVEVTPTNNNASANNASANNAAANNAAANNASANNAAANNAAAPAPDNLPQAGTLKRNKANLNLKDYFGKK